VNFSSVQGLEGRENMPAYTAAKFGVRGLTKTTAIELGPLGIRVNTLIPGPTRTKMTERKGWKAADYDEAYSGYPLGRMADPGEIAKLALFLASDESSFCTGGDFAADYKYRSFSLDGSNGLPDRGFLRAKAVSTP